MQHIALIRTNKPEAVTFIRYFIGLPQLAMIAECITSDRAEAEHYLDRLTELTELVRDMPATGQQEGKGDDAIVYLHYYTSGADWYIIEKDILADQRQAFGLADLGMGFPELGYISIPQCCYNGAELDLHFTPRTLRELKESRYMEYLPEDDPDFTAPKQIGDPNPELSLV